MDGNGRMGEEQPSVDAIGSTGPAPEEGQDALTLASRMDTRILGRAIREGWPIRPSLKAKAVRELEAVIDDPSAGALRKVSAVRALIAADQVNAKREATEAATQTHAQGQHASLFRAALATPEGRAALAALTHSMAHSPAPPGEATALGPAPQPVDQPPPPGQHGSSTP